VSPRTSCIGIFLREHYREVCHRGLLARFRGPPSLVYSDGGPSVLGRALEMPGDRNNPLGHDAVPRGVRPRSNGGESPLGDLDLKDRKGEVNRE
jgi:hypothetical protein